MRYQRFYTWILIILIALLIGGALVTIDSTWVIDPDSAAYVGLARSLMAGEGYSFQGAPHTKYPPLFPLVLAGAAGLGGSDNYGLMQYLVAVFWILLIVLTYLLYSGRGIQGSSFTQEGLPKGPLTGWVMALLIAASIYMLQYATTFLRTEPLFTAFILAAVWVGIKIQQSTTPPILRLVGFAFLFQCAYFTRMAGAALLAALVLALLFEKGGWVRKERRWGRALLLILLCAAGPALWMIRNEAKAGPASTDYASEFTQSYGLDLTKNRDLEMDKLDPGSMARRVAENGMVFAESTAKMLLNSNKGGAKLGIRLAFGALCGFGLLLALVNRRSFVDYFCALYLLLYLVWPFNQQQRFYMPLFPFLVEYAALSILFMNRFLPILLRQTGVWYLFFALQIPLLAVLFAEKSQQVQVFGRYSYPYLAFLVTVTVVILATDIYLLWERRRPGGLKWMVTTLRLGLPLLYLCGFASLGFQELLVTYPENKRKFLDERRRNPVSAPFEKIEAHPAFIELAKRIIEETEPNDVIMCDVPKMVHLLTGRQTVPFTFYGKTKKLAREVNGLEPAYVYYSGEIVWVYEIFEDSTRGLDRIFYCRLPLGGDKYIEPALYRLKPPQETHEQE